jgi:hypothetical protein
MFSASDSCVVTQHCSIFWFLLYAGIVSGAGISRSSSEEAVQKHVKIHTSPLPDLVSNWEDVSEMLNRMEYARFLDDADYVS